MYSLGIFFTSLIRLLLDQKYDVYLNYYFLYLILLFPIITCVIRMAMLLIFFDFDTPRYYVSLNKDKAAKEILYKFYSG